MVDIDLYGGETPSVTVNICDMFTAVPFRHSLSLYIKNDQNDYWSFDGMDEEEFTPEMRRIRD